MTPRPLVNVHARFTAPEGWDQELHGKCETLETGRFGNQTYSIWKLSPEELALITESGSIVLWIYGSGHPVVSLTVLDPSDEGMCIDVTQEDQAQSLKQENEVG